MENTASAMASMEKLDHSNQAFPVSEFIDENTGFLTMPLTGGENSDLYITRDCGKTFSKVTILESDIYDYYNLPTIENEKMYLEIGQGSDGDYNGGDSKKYCSEDKGNSWNIVN